MALCDGSNNNNEKMRDITWTARSVGEKSTESEYYGSLVFLDNL